jgi:hypothetical protein
MHQGAGNVLRSFVDMEFRDAPCTKVLEVTVRQAGRGKFALRASGAKSAGIDCSVLFLLLHP